MNRKLVTLAMLLVSGGVIFASEYSVSPADRQALIATVSRLDGDYRKTREKLFQEYEERDPTCCQTLVINSLRNDGDAQRWRDGCAYPVAISALLGPPIASAVGGAYFGCCLTELMLSLCGRDNASSMINRRLYEYVTADTPRAPEGMKED